MALARPDFEPLPSLNDTEIHSRFARRSSPRPLCRVLVALVDGCWSLVQDVGNAFPHDKQRKDLLAAHSQTANKPMPDLAQLLKRGAKSARNIFADPLPRNRVLRIDSMTVDNAKITFGYFAMDRSFQITLTLPRNLAVGIPLLPESARSQLLTATAIAFAPFFFKLSDFERVDVQTATLDHRSRVFFETFLTGGLGEFRYLQGLNPARKIRVTAAEDTSTVVAAELPTRDHLLLLNGGGKDTIVAAELLKAGGQSFGWVTIRPNPTRRRVIEVSGVTEAIEIEYDIDTQIDELRAYPWGHIPHTSIVLALGVLSAMLTGSRYVAAGNEYSSSFGNLRFRGAEVNHQYTKSYEYERGFSDFVRRRVTSSIEVFSVLRPFHDLQLAQLFSRQTRYMKHFVSCNRGIRTGKWCLQCPKCAFTALALYPFTDAGQRIEIFGEDPLQRAPLRQLVIDLASGATKPWECVGTRDECLLALSMLLERNRELHFSQAPRRRDLERVVRDVNVQALRHDILTRTQTEHSIPKPVATRLQAGLACLGAGELSVECTGSAH